MVIFPVCYNLAFKKTLSELRNLNENSRQLSLLKDAPIQLQRLDKKLQEIEGIFSSSIESGDNLEVILLERATLLVKNSNLRVIELPKNSSYSQNGFKIKTQQIVIQGPFNELLKFLHSIEQDPGIGKICSIVFYARNEIKESNNSPKMRIYFQTIIQDLK